MKWIKMKWNLNKTLWKTGQLARPFPTTRDDTRKWPRRGKMKRKQLSPAAKCPLAAPATKPTAHFARGLVKHPYRINEAKIKKNWARRTRARTKWVERVGFARGFFNRGSTRTSRLLNGKKTRTFFKI